MNNNGKTKCGVSDNGEEMSKENMQKLFDDVMIPQFVSQAGLDVLTPNPLAIHPVYCRAYCSGFDYCKRIIMSRYNLVEKETPDDIVF